MPRNIVGVFTLAEPLFEIGTVIESSLVNNDLSDIATALTDTINTAGTVPMTAAFRMVNSEVISGAIIGSSNVGIGAVADNYGLVNATTGEALAVFKLDLDVDWFGDHNFPVNVTFADLCATEDQLDVTTLATYQGREVTSFDVGTVTMFWDVSPPTGWSVLGLNDWALRIVDGAGGGSTFGAGFSVTFSQFLSSFSAPDNDVHAHNVLADNPIVTAFVFSPQGVTDTAIISSSSGTTTNHTHFYDLRVLFMDVILAAKL